MSVWGRAIGKWLADSHRTDTDDLYKRVLGLYRNERRLPPSVLPKQNITSSPSSSAQPGSCQEKKMSTFRRGYVAVPTRYVRLHPDSRCVGGIFFSRIMVDIHRERRGERGGRTNRFDYVVWTKATVGGVPPLSLVCLSHSHE